MNAARKAVRTRKARDTMFQTVGSLKYWVLEDLSHGMTTAEVADRNGISVESAAAFAANLTRGAYDKLLRHCNF